jgi:hypothetical protein
MLFVGIAKFGLGRDEEAIAWFHRNIEANRNFPLAHSYLAAALSQVDRLDPARSAVRAGLTLNRNFTVRRFCRTARSDDPTVRAQGRRLVDSLRKGGVPDE